MKGKASHSEPEDEPLALNPKPASSLLKPLESLELAPLFDVALKLSKPASLEHKPEPEPEPETELEIEPEPKLEPAFLSSKALEPLEQEEPVRDLLELLA